MKPQTFQHPEIRDENDNIIQPGAFGKNTPFCTKGNDGILDYVANDLEYLYKQSVSADNDNLKAKSLAVSGTSDLNLVNSDTVKAKSLAVTETGTAPTAPENDNSKTIANTEFVQRTVSKSFDYVDIAENKDLNDYISRGLYICRSSNIAKTISNCPDQKAFILEVLPMFNAQKLTIYDGTAIYMRYKTTWGNKNWSNWIKYAGTQI